MPKHVNTIAEWVSLAPMHAHEWLAEIRCLLREYEDTLVSRLNNPLNMGQCREIDSKSLLATRQVLDAMQNECDSD